MSYGDGLASVVGIRFGKKKYQLFQDTKSYIGSFAMFCFTVILLLVAMIFYGTLELTDSVFFIIPGIAAIATFVEGATPRGLDNLSVPFVTAFLYWFTLGVV
jgi:dolichol kinase